MIEKVREDVAQKMFFDAWGKSLIDYAADNWKGRKLPSGKISDKGALPAEVLAGLRDLKPEDIWPNREQRDTTFFNKFGEGDTTYHLKIVEGKPVASWGISNYGEFYATAGAFSVGSNLFPMLGENFGVDFDDKETQKSMAYLHTMKKDVLKEYLDKPILVYGKAPNTIAVEGLIGKFGFKEIKNIDNLKLNEVIKGRLKSFPKGKLVIRMSGPLPKDEIKNSFDYIWKSHIIKDKKRGWQSILKRC